MTKLAIIWINQKNFNQGDSFTGAFITTLLNGETLEEAHRIAVKRAAAVCSVAGAWLVDFQQELNGK
jgi:sugar/nucleoside kinase (ribokinase family)